MAQCLQRLAKYYVRRSVIGARVEWDAELISIRDDEEGAGRKRLVLQISGALGITPVAIVNDTPSLLLLRENDKLRITGTIANNSKPNHIVLSPAEYRKL